jgi:hypothetical protein
VRLSFSSPFPFRHTALRSRFTPFGVVLGWRREAHVDGAALRDECYQTQTNMDLSRALRRWVSRATTSNLPPMPQPRLGRLLPSFQAVAASLVPLMAPPLARRSPLPGRDAPRTRSAAPRPTKPQRAPRAAAPRRGAGSARQRSVGLTAAALDHTLRSRAPWRSPLGRGRRVTLKVPDASKPLHVCNAQFRSGGRRLGLGGAGRPCLLVVAAQGVFVLDAQSQGDLEGRDGSHARILLALRAGEASGPAAGAGAGAGARPGAGGGGGRAWSRRRPGRCARVSRERRRGRAGRGAQSPGWAAQSCHRRAPLTEGTV